MGLKESTKQDDIPLRLVYNGVPNTFAHQLDGSLKEGDSAERRGYTAYKYLAQQDTVLKTAGS